MPHIYVYKYQCLNMIQIQCIGARAHTNNFPLALVPIMHNPKTEGSNISFMFWSSQLHGQWICHIALDNLSNEMVLPEYVFRSLV